MKAVLGFVLLVLAFSGTAPAIAAVTENQCDACHSQYKWISQNPVLYEYYQDWLRSPHKNAGITCDACHGGDPTKADEDEAHEGVMAVDDPRSKVNYLNQPETCGVCHRDIADRQKTSAHYKALRENKAAPSCATCHRAMNKKPFYGSIIQLQCLNCHGESEHKVKGGATPQQVALAREILHRLHVAKGYLGWTSVYYASQDWPGDSKQKIEQLRRDYHEVVVMGHGLDLDNTSVASLRLLAELRDMFTAAWDKETPGSAP